VCASKAGQHLRTHFSTQNLAYLQACARYSVLLAHPGAAAAPAAYAHKGCWSAASLLLQWYDVGLRFAAVVSSQALTEAAASGHAPHPEAASSLLLTSASDHAPHSVAAAAAAAAAVRDPYP